MNPESKDRSFREAGAGLPPSAPPAEGAPEAPTTPGSAAAVEAGGYTGPERRAQGILVAEIIVDGEPEHRAPEGPPR